ncbi:DEAD/DEAH box helicase family protein [Actinoplanes sp. TRM 88003]|uniref:DEAD/DEAH box helicase family protein n=1 Tax=Paractinoplanes aksuensis TaxID=2939490 RepID=A0ABT1DIT3_9ACTN|nr:DEAD/DEAH box helicase family protein [Actinoplanes aksuensis]MCO8270737.1 DEAD/DEAH box helicase family protein [Actinoplanes aksuensis]
MQNAADAMAGTAADIDEFAGRVEIVLDTAAGTLYCANAGRPFSRGGLIAITHAHLSGKRGDEIGRFGLGFKSVLAVSNFPQVFSRSVSFEFNSREATSAIAGVGSGAKRYPILRTATVVDPTAEFARDPILAELAEWATTVVKLPSASSIPRLRSEILRFKSQFLLFVGDVREVRLRIVGAEPFETTHVSRNLGDGLFRIERSGGESEEWIVEDRMHAPSADARRQVGEAVSRAEVKVTVAIPKRRGREYQVGQFWSYFPLQDKTSASALFNAPWSVNDDRTTLLRNDYNREILVTLAGMFGHKVALVRTSTDPASHLDYLPARGKEELSFGDEVLCAQVPQICADLDLIPDATGVLTQTKMLTPLDFAAAIPEDVQEAWINSPNTGTDVPHWRCYSTQQRITRMRRLFAAEYGSGLIATEVDVKRALAAMPKRGVMSWLREWAEGTDPVSAANAFRFVCKQRNVEGFETAKVIPTTDGLRTLRDNKVVFLRQEKGVEIEGAVFVLPRFLAQPGVEVLLRQAGFRDLDPLAILTARLARLTTTSGDEEYAQLWKSAEGVSLNVAVKTLEGHADRVKVPTRDGGWAWGRQVIDVDVDLSEVTGVKALDRERCVPQAAHALGVVRDSVRNFSVEDELYFDAYRTWVLEQLNALQGPGERPVERIELTEGAGPGPFSMLYILRDAGASQQLRANWTTALLQAGSSYWSCEDVDSGVTYTVFSPVRWAADVAGLVNSSRGFLPPSMVVAPSVVRYEKLLPMFRGSSQVADALELPEDLDAVPVPVLREALAATLLPPGIADDVLVDFILGASRIAYAGAQPPAIPARVGRVTESRSPATVYLAVSDEQEKFLASRQRPYLRVSVEMTAELVEAVGCRRFEDSFAFSMLIEGEQESEPIVDVFTGLRTTHVARKVENATLTRAALVSKRVTTEDGVEDQTLDWHRDGLGLVARSDADERRLLRFVDEAFELHLTNAELEQVLKAGLDHRLEELRQRAKAAANDADRLDVYFGSDDLREALPKGLWQALEAQDLVDDDTSVAELFLTVYGSDSIKQLAQNFRQEGFPDVPTEWAGRSTTISWLRKMGFGTEYAGRRNQRQDQEFVVPGAVKLNELHTFQKKISADLRRALTLREANGRHLKAMVELPTGAGKTRVATETVLRLFIEDMMRGPVLWIAQSQELCEQAVQTTSTVWRGLGDERPLTVGRLWEGNTVHEPDTEFSFIVATDAQLDVIRADPDYDWLKEASAVIIDEGHRAGGSERYTRILNWLGVAGWGFARPLIGLSATPFKGTSESGTAALVNRFGGWKIDAFEQDNAYRRLADLGVLAQVQHQVLPGVDVELQPGERNDARTLRRISQSVMDRIGRDHARMKILVNHIMGLDPDWPVLVFTPNVLSAQVLAATLRYRGATAESVSGQTGRQERRNIIERFKKGEVRILANCDLLIQGFDAPAVRALYIARPTFSPNAYIQMAGRGLRGPANGGKDECLIVDMADNFGDVTELLGYREYEDLWQEHRP